MGWWDGSPPTAHEFRGKGPDGNESGGWFGGKHRGRPVDLKAMRAKQAREAKHAKQVKADKAKAAKAARAAKAKGGKK